MATKIKYTFYVDVHPDNYFIGRCRELPQYTYTPQNGKTRDAALSGIKRLVAKLSGTSDVKKATTKSDVNVPPGTSVKRKENRIAFVIDRSGSMCHLTENVLDAFKQNVQTLIEQQAATDQETRVSVIVFNNRINVIRTLVNPSMLNINISDILPVGSTALNDAIAAGIDAITTTHEDPNVDVSYLVCVLTDGEENKSVLHSTCSIKHLIAAKQATDRWSFTFLVPPGAKKRVAFDYGLYDGNVQGWEYSARGVQTYAAQNNVGLQAYYGARTMGVNSVRSFYTDASKLTTSQVKANLVDVRNDVSLIDVKKVAQIREVVEAKTRQPYVTGTAFYQLLKSEKVQSYKKMIIVDRTTKAVYAGDAARSMLGIPTTVGEIKVAPGANGNYDVYVQSTSVNRKVYPGSSVIYYPNGR